jgi:hypothetical protein
VDPACGRHVLHSSRNLHHEVNNKIFTSLPSKGKTGNLNADFEQLQVARHKTFILAREHNTAHIAVLPQQNRN